MSEPPSQRSTLATNELAKERNRAAADRTLIAWLQNCLVLISLGLAIDQIGRAITPQSGAIADRNRWVELTALGFIGFGIGLMGMAMGQYWLQLRAIDHDDCVLLSIQRLNQLVLAAVLLFGALSGLAIVLLL